LSVRVAPKTTGAGDGPGMMGTVTGDVPPQLRDRDAWTGGWYELAMQLGEHDAVRLQSALGVLARAAGITEPWHVQWQPDHRVWRADWNIAGLDGDHLRGQVQLPGGQQVICSVIAIRETDGDDWLLLGIPLEALGHGDPRIGGVPYDNDNGALLAWRRPIDDWFARLAEQVRVEIGFRLAAIGWEADGFVITERDMHQPRDRFYWLVWADGTYVPAAG
jgi:hypothetical protein